MDVEALAVSKIQKMIARCPHLKAFIASNDKTPFTDGFIDLYDGLAQGKSEFRGRVPVQVKGRTRQRKQKQPTFPISRTDLIGFQKESGVLFFYVEMDRNGKQVAPYYAILSPFTIEHILRSVPDEQATVAVPFKKFPSLPAEIEPILGLALKTRDQNPSLGFEPALFEQMQSITVHALSDLKLEEIDEPVVLAPGRLDYALEIVTEGGMRVPLGGELHIYPAAYAEHAFDAVISAGGVSYSDLVRKQIDAKSMMIKLAPGFTLTATESDSQRRWNFAFAAEGTFEERLKAARFIEGFLEGGTVSVNGEPTSLGTLVDASQPDLAELRKQINLIFLMDELFEYLEIDKALVDLDSVSEAQIRDIRMLHRALVLKEEIESKTGEVSRGLFSIGKWAVMVLITEGRAPGRWRFVDPFDPHAPHLFRWSTDEDDPAKAYPVTVYDVVEKDELPSILNLRLDEIVRAYDAIVDAEQTLHLANHKVLALIAAADTTPLRTAEFLRAADALNEWVIDHEGDLPVHLINRWQIRHRLGTLSSSELDEIRGMRRSIVKSKNPRATEIELACALLLGDTAEADYLATQLPAGKVTEMKGWPIWALRDSLHTTDPKLPDGISVLPSHRSTRAVQPSVVACTAVLSGRRGQESDPSSC